MAEFSKVRHVHGEQDRIDQLYALLKMYGRLLRIERFDDYHFRLHLMPDDSPYEYRADYWPRTGTLILQDDGHRKREFAANPKQVIRRLVSDAGLQETIRITKEHYGS